MYQSLLPENQLFSSISCLISALSSGCLTLPRFSLGTGMMSPVSLSHPEWDVSIQSYVLRTNYEEYAVILMKKKSSFGPSTTLKLYGMSGYGTCG